MSRGAKFATFVDSSRSSIEVTKENLLSTGLMTNARIASMDSIDFLKGTKSTYDIALLDPPYHKGILLSALPLLEKIMNPGGIVICEHERELTLPDNIERLEKIKSYNYGKITLSLLKIKEDDE